VAMGENLRTGPGGGQRLFTLATETELPVESGRAWCSGAAYLGRKRTFDDTVSPWVFAATSGSAWHH
jgi:hypothetical protein